MQMIIKTPTRSIHCLPSAKAVSGESERFPAGLDNTNRRLSCFLSTKVAQPKECAGVAINSEMKQQRRKRRGYCSAQGPSTSVSFSFMCETRGTFIIPTDSAVIILSFCHPTGHPLFLLN